MKRITLILALVAPIAACKTPEPQIIVREVPVVTPVACVDPAVIPEEPPTVGNRFNGDAKHDLQILAPNAQALRKWGKDLRALLDSCAVGGQANAGGAAGESDTQAE